MIGAAVSDLHLGFRAFAASIDGRNAREVDVERAWENAVDTIIEDCPHLVTVAGDIFHTVRPSMHAIRAWQLGVRRIIAELPDVHIVAILGNHETGRTAETLSPVVVVEGEPRVHVVTRPKRIRLNLGGETVSIACLPFVALAGEETYRLDPDPLADVNVLLVHAAVRGGENGDALPRFYAGDDALDIAREAERWTVCHAGDFHDFTKLHPTALAFYSGAIERTTSNIWQEQPKGVVVYNTVTRQLQLREIPTRPVHDYSLDDDFDVLRVFGGIVYDLNIALGALLDDEAYATRDAIVRLRVDNFPREDREQIAWATVRQLKSHCLSFQLDLRFAERESVSLGDRRESRGRTIHEAAAEFLADEPAEVRETALGYLSEEAA